MRETRKTMINTPAAIVGRTLARDAVLLARVAAPEDAEVARRLASALRDPARVERFLADDSRRSPAARIA